MNQLRLFFLIFLAICGGRASALAAFECVRDLMPISEQANFQMKRDGVEHPFMVGTNYMAFPEITNKHLSGFYVYNGDQAWYYNSVVERERTKPITALTSTGEHPVYDLVAQPQGLETISLQYLPGFNEDEKTGEGSAVLGASVLPVVGALISRGSQDLHAIYHNPAQTDPRDVKQWIYDHTSRKPAEVSVIEIRHALLQLAAQGKKSDKDLWTPLNAEVEIRKNWVRSHNLDDDSFKRLSKIMATSCH